jgi:hypothetical protein
MSEYQYVAFRAIDAQLSEKNLDYMRRQSTRAVITPWSFENEYEFGEFRGNAPEMLRRGYDVHLHYANFGYRRLMLRLPQGFPDAAAAAPYLEKDLLDFSKDPSGPGGILCIDPYLESDTLEEIWELEPVLERLLPLRGEILEGDLRPLYLAHLALVNIFSFDPDEWREPPVPAGLDQLTDAQSALAEYYGLDQPLLAAATQDAPQLPAAANQPKPYRQWIARQPESAKIAWLAELMEDPHSSVRSDLLSKFRQTERAISWPTASLERRFDDLQRVADEIREAGERRATQAAARNRARRLKQMASDPAKILSQTEQLVEQQSRNAYEQLATLLADLREAVSGTKDSGLAEKQARKLSDQYPTRRTLISALRKQGFSKK